MRTTVAHETFQVGDSIFVKADPAGDESKLPDILQGRWVGKVLECKAYNEQAVFVRLVWYQRPEDLPCGRQPYHGTNELIASNDSHIIDASKLEMLHTGRPNANLQ
jgi:hypothetical protein